MDLRLQVGKGAQYFARRAGGIILPLLLIACASPPVQHVSNVESEAVDINQVDNSVAEASTIEPLPLSPELMYYILTAEIAGQRGELGIAIELYQRAAALADSPLLASRAAQVASYSRDQALIYQSLERWAEVSPDDASVYMMRVPFLLMQSDFDGVVAAVNRALELAPQEAEKYLNNLTGNLSELGDPDQALLMMRQLDSYQSGMNETRFSYARLATFFRQYLIAEPEIDALLNQDVAADQREELLILKAEIMQRTDRSEEAIKLIANAAKNRDASGELRFIYGKLLGENGYSGQAQAVFEDLYLENPENPDTLFALGLLALEQQDGELAKVYFSELLKMGDNGRQAAYFMGLAEELNDDIDAALVWFASVPAQNPRFEAAQTRYINMLAERGEIDKARQHISYLRMDNPEQALQFYLFEAAFLRDNDRPQAAFDLFGEALEKYPGNFELLYSRALVAESLNRLSVVEDDLLSILERDPDNAQALNALGYTLTDRTDRHEEAYGYITRALELKPNDPYYLDSLGWVYYRMGDLDNAEKYLRQAIDIQDDIEFIVHLGEVLWQQGQHQEARQMWDRARQIDADNTLLKETLRRFRQ